jgi:hypothetical protein
VRRVGLLISWKALALVHSTVYPRSPIRRRRPTLKRWMAWQQGYLKGHQVTGLDLDRSIPATGVQAR